MCNDNTEWIKIKKNSVCAAAAVPSVQCREYEIMDRIFR